MQHILLFITTLPVLIIGDVLWVGFIADKFYTSHIGHLRGPIQWSGAILFWLIYTLGILLFVVYPYMNSTSKTVIYGALFGFIAYSVYNLTNQATLRDWPITVVVVDVLWGTLLTVTVAIAGHYLSKLFF